MIRLLLPALEIATVLWLIHCVYWRRYLALIAYLSAEALHQILLVLFGVGVWGPLLWIRQPIYLAIRTWVVVEIFHLGCVRMSRMERIHTVAWAVCAASIAALGFMPPQRFEALTGFEVFRSFFCLLLAGALIGLCLRIWRNPIMENTDHRAYRVVMTVNFARLALSATIVRGGMDYLLLGHHTLRAWLIADAISWIGAGLCVGWLAWWMTSSVSCLRPEVAARRRKAEFPAEYLEAAKG